MKQIGQDMYLFEGLRGCNTYLLVSDSGLTLVDSGMAGDVDRILAQIRQLDLDPSNVRSIVITHAHTDHIGGAAGLARRFGAAVIAHRLEAPYLEAADTLPARTRLQKAMTWLGDRFPGNNEGIHVAQRLEDGDRLDVLGGLRVIHTPGHTPGSISLLQEGRGILFCGDLLFHGNPLTGRGGLRYAPRTFSVDPDELVISAQKLSTLSITALCMGHGRPVIQETGVTMANLLEGLPG